MDLWRDHDGLRLDIVDDGVGFEQAGETRQANGEHIGLQIMRERAERIGAELDIASRPSEGTRIALRFRHNHSDPGVTP